MTARVTESPEAVRQAVLEILRAPGREVPRPVAQIRAYRSAARRVVEADLPARAKHVMVAALAEDLRQAELPEWCRRAVWEETAHTLFGRPPPWDPRNPFPPLSWETAQHRLAEAGFDRCPACITEVAPSSEISRIRMARASTDALKEARRRATETGDPQSVILG